MLNKVTSSGQTPSTLAELPVIRTFQMGAGGIGSIPNSVNLFRGDVNVPLELISLPGRGDLDVKVAIMYQSNVQHMVDTWNLEAPTGILGLGWSMPYEMVAIDTKNTGSTYDDVYYLVSGGGANRLHQVYQDGASNLGKKDEVWTFETEDYKPWDICYYPKEERWVIVKENGLIQTYGGGGDKPAKENPHIHWGVKWGGENGNWIGSSTNTSGQQQFALAWNLAEIRNTWGEKVTFEYESELEQIGVDGFSYTRACYLKQITDICGRTVNFIYKPKQNDENIREYQIPHKDPELNHHAYQERYETKYLASIEVKQKPDSPLPLFSVHFDYELKNVSKNVSLKDFNDANFYKRYLKQINQRNANGECLPGYKFDYYTVAIDFNTHLGALKTITYPEGGSATFTFQKTTLLGTSHNILIDDVRGIPRVWFGSDYVVVASYDDSGSGTLKISAYSWNGKWISSDEETFTAKLDINSLQVVTQTEFFALSFKTEREIKLYLFHRVLGRFAKWDYQNYYLDLPSKESQNLLAVGSDFIVAGASSSANWGRYVWNQKSEKWDEESFTINKGECVLAASNNYFVLGSYNANSKSCELKLYFRNEITETWMPPKSLDILNTISANENGHPYLQLSPSNTFVTATFRTNIGNSIDYEMRVYQWDRTFEQVKTTVWKLYNLPSDTQQPYSIASDSLVGNLGHIWRYNGTDWKSDNLTIDTKEEYKFAYGSDLAIASSSNSIEIKTYNPYRDEWKRPSIEVDGSKNEYQPTISGNFVTVGNAIFYRNSQGELKKDQRSLPSGIKAESIVNRAPYYIACESNDGQTQVFLLKNGKVVGTEKLPERIYVDKKSQGQSGPILAGGNAFVTYQGNDFDSTRTLHIYRVVDESISEHLSDFPVVKVTVNDGYEKRYTSYKYDISKIALSGDGLVKQYSRVTVVSGSDNPQQTPFGKTVHYFYDGLSAESLNQGLTESLTSAPVYYYGFLNGMLRQRRVYDTTGKEVARETTEYEIVTKRKNKDDYREVDLYGALVQVKSQESILYGEELGVESNVDKNLVGVSKRIEYEYDPATGFLFQETTYNYNGTGEKETLTKSYIHGWRKYEGLRKQNILTPVVQTTTKTNEKTTAIAVSTWKNWEANSNQPEKWGLYKTYQAKQENAEFDDWNNQQEPSAADWLKVSEVVSRGVTGVVQEIVDVSGVTAATIFDKTQLYSIAKFVNAGATEVTYAGFEEYEELEGWRLSGSSELLGDCIVTGDAHTGLCSLKLNPAVKLQTTLSVTNPNQSYVFSGWVKTEAGFDKDGGEAEWRIQFYEGDTLRGDSIVVRIHATDGEWKYWYCAINSNQIPDKSDRLTLEACNGKTSKYLLLDDIGFWPLVGTFQANVYDPKYKIVTAQLGQNANTQRYVYDAFQRRVAEIGPSENVNAVTATYLTRQDNALFSQDEPNSILNIIAQQGGLYDNFTNGDRWQQNWKPSSSGSWKVENRALVHNGSSSSITYELTKSWANYGVRVSVRPGGAIQQPLGIQIGSKLTVKWMPNKGWSLVINSNLLVEQPGKIAGEWLLVAANQTILFYADGRQVFAQHLESEISGALQLFAGDEVAFRDVVVFQAPQLAMTYADGAGNQRQTQALNGTDCLVAGKVYDQLGRPAVETKTAQFKNAVFAYQQGFVQSIDWQSGVLRGEVADYYPQDEGYPYSRTAFEASPLGRAVKQGIPGKEFAIREGNSHIATSEYGTNHKGEFGSDNYPDGQYFVEKVTDANGTPVLTLKDKLERTLATKAGPIEAGSNIYQMVRYEYDQAGNPVKVLMPNHFNPPEGSQPNAWEISMTYDFLGQMTSRISPDSGMQKYVYDQTGQLRFLVDAVGLESRTILYKKYDVLGRLVEEGWFSGDWGDGSWLQEKADSDPNWPHQPNTYTWCKQYVFDGDGSNPYLVGQPWKVLSSNGGNGTADVEEVYEYDKFGNVVSKTLTVAEYQAQTIRYEYDNIGNVTKVCYPEGSSSHIAEVVYTYNQLGQTIGVGVPQNRKRFAAYTYKADGSLATSTLHNVGSQSIAKTLDYNSPGWPTRIDNQFIEQSLTYTSDGYNGAGYYNGNIAKASIQYGKWDNAPGNYDYNYQYDSIGQLKVAQNSQDEGASLGVGEPTTYDTNGNIQKLKQGDTTENYQYIANTNKVDNVSDHKQAYSYDANGNVKTASHRNITNIAYDPLTQLTTKVELGGSFQSSVSFKYNGNNQRVLKSQQDSAGKQTAAKLYVHGLNDYPLLEMGSESVQYIYGLDGLLALIKDGTVYYVLKDHLGSTRVVVNEAGTVIATFDYLPFGDLMGKPYGNPEIISYRFTGQELDSELGFHNYRARFYDSDLGRFYAIDSKQQYFSPYIYAGNNPINLYDPNGEFAFLVPLLIGAILGAVGGGLYANAEGKSGWSFVGYMAAGAGIGALSAVVFTGVAAGTTSLVASWVGEEAVATIAGGVVGGATGGSVQGGLMGLVTDAGADEWWKGAAVGAVGGLIGGSLGYLGKATYRTFAMAEGGFLQAVRQNPRAVLQQLGIGGASGAAASSTNAALHGGDWDSVGKSALFGFAVGGATTLGLRTNTWTRNTYRYYQNVSQSQNYVRVQRFYRPPMAIPRITVDAIGRNRKSKGWW